MTKSVVGLGNPGKEYENTRHNIGFIFIEALAKKLEAPDFEFDKKLNADVSRVGKSLILAKPQTYMNKSGAAVAALARFYKIKPKDIFVIHDDIDILWGKYKISFGRSSAGHKGVESIIRAIKTKDIWRVRIGIQPKLVTSDKRQATRISAEKIILKKFTPAERKFLDQTIKKAVSQLETTLDVS